MSAKVFSGAHCAWSPHTEYTWEMNARQLCLLAYVEWSCRVSTFSITERGFLLSPNMAFSVLIKPNIQRFKEDNIIIISRIYKMFIRLLHVPGWCSYHLIKPHRGSGGPHWNDGVTSVSLQSFLEIRRKVLAMQLRWQSVLAWVPSLTVCWDVPSTIHTLISKGPLRAYYFLLILRLSSFIPSFLP